MRKARTAVGGNSQTYRPEQVVPRGTLNLPGVRASVQVWDVDDIACIYDPHARTLSIIARLEVNGFLMKNTGEKYTLAQQWGQVLSAFTKRPGVKRVTMQERTTPTTIRAAREHYEEMSARRDFTLPEELSTSYRQVLDQSERFAVAHQNYLTLTFDLVALQGQLKSLGGGRKAIQQLGVLEARNAGDALRAAGISVPKWLSSRDVGGLTRTAFDPEFLSTMQNRPDALAGVDLSAMGPMFLEEPANKAGIVRTDSGVHQTMWIHEWPRLRTASRVRCGRHPHPLDRDDAGPGGEGLEDHPRRQENMAVQRAHEDQAWLWWSHRGRGRLARPRAARVRDRGRTRRVPLRRLSDRHGPERGGPRAGGGGDA